MFPINLYFQQYKMNNSLNNIDFKNQQLYIKSVQQMLGDNIDLKVLKAILLTILSILALIIIFIIKSLTGSYIFGLIVFISLIWLIIFKIGITIMYPGSSNYFRGDIQIRIGNQIAKNLHQFGHCCQFVAQCVVEKKISFHRANWNMRNKLLEAIHSNIQMLSMFENSLSQRKTKLLDIFRQLAEEIQYKNMNLTQQSQAQLSSIREFLQTPQQIKHICQQNHQFLISRMKSIITLNSSLQQVLTSYKVPQGTIDFLKYKFLSQKLYQVRFGYQRWNYIFQYQVHLVNNYGNTLQTALIKRNRRYQNVRSNGKVVMFCNPNGVYIQFFALENSYVRQYLRHGYQVILWNYRGYGQSTGSPSITKCQTDAMKVYNYFSNKGLNIQLVHGYSIGGCAAIGLVHKLEKRQKHLAKNTSSSITSLRTENTTNSIKLIIVDRSFSSIGDMAIQFGDTLHNLASVVFTFQNKNLSLQFRDLKTQKIMIWDSRDQVIPDSASVKSGLFREFLSSPSGSSCKSLSNYLNNPNQSLNQQVSVLINQNEQHQTVGINKGFLIRFSKAMKVLVEWVRDIKKVQEWNVNANHQFDPMQLNQHIQNQMQASFDVKIVNKVLDVMQLLDGAGAFLPHPPIQFKNLLNKNLQSFQYKCHSYLLGLNFYGSVLPFQIGFASKSTIQAHTIKKLNVVIQNFQKILDQTSDSKIIDACLISSIQTINKTLIQTLTSIQSSFLLQQNLRFGKIIACNNGHNGSLSSQQLFLLMKHIQLCCNPNSVEFISSMGQIGLNQYSNRINSVDSLSINTLGTSKISRENIHQFQE